MANKFLSLVLLIAAVGFTQAALESKNRHFFFTKKLYNQLILDQKIFINK